MSYQHIDSQKPTDNPYENFLEHFNSEKNPNFLWYTLTVLEKHSYAQQADLFKKIRQRMEKKYNIKSPEIWKKMKNSETNE